MVTSIILYGLVIPLAVCLLTLLVVYRTGHVEGSRACALGIGASAAFLGAFGLPSVPPAEFAHYLAYGILGVGLCVIVVTMANMSAFSSDRLVAMLSIFFPFPCLIWQMQVNGIDWASRFTETGLWLTVSACFLIATLGWTMSPLRDTRRTAGWTLGTALAAMAVTLFVTNSARLGQAMAGASAAAFVTRIIDGDEAEQRMFAVGMATLVGAVVYAQAFMQLPSISAVTVLIIPLIAIGAREDDERTHRVAAVVLAVCLAIASIGIAVDAHHERLGDATTWESE